MRPDFREQKTDDLIHEAGRLAQEIARLEKRLDKYGNVLRAMFELMRAELHIEPAALAERLAAVVREKGERERASCGSCGRPLGNRAKCMYCGTERKAESLFDLL